MLCNNHATSTQKTASMLDLARNKLRNIHATSSQQIDETDNAFVARFFVDEHGKLQPKIEPAQPPRRIIFCRDCRHYIAVPPVHQPHGAPREAPGGCRQGHTTPDSWPPIYPFTGWFCGDWVASEPASGSRLRQE